MPNKDKTASYCKYKRNTNSLSARSLLHTVAAGKLWNVLWTVTITKIRLDEKNHFLKYDADSYFNAAVTMTSE